MEKHKSNSKSFFYLLKQHLIDNSKLYAIVSVFFVIGIILGVTFYNNLDSDVQGNINDYIAGFIQDVKDGYEIDSYLLLRQTIIKNISFVIILWFMGCTVIGLPIVYGMISYKGFSLGYTICCIIGILGINNGTVFCILSLFLQNFIAIPVYIALGVSGNKLYKSIIKNKRRENIKLEILRHTVICFMLLLVLLLASLIEVYISTSLTELYMRVV